MSDKLMTCPYDSNHRIRPERFPYHLVNCKRSHKTTLTSVCPFNSAHVMPPSQLRNHMATCEDSFRIAKEVKLCEMQPDEELHNSCWYEFGAEEEEDWDKEIDNSKVKNRNPKSTKVEKVDPTDTYFVVTKKERKERTQQLVDKYKLELFQKEYFEKEKEMANQNQN